jgi:putative spermidine/putrescine transport system ATP-binding protein
MSDLVIKDLVKRYHPSDPPVVKEISLSVQKGELVSLLGPSGCGKTTILRMIAGLLLPDSGDISIRDKEITKMPSYRRDVGMVFQSYALFPHMTVEQNIGFGLKMRKVKGEEAKRRINEALDMVNLKGYGDRYPNKLSGGQQQRVALARALVTRPAVLLLDEPLSALDAKLREETREEIRRLQQNLEVATVFVTHDQEEALAMSDRVAVLNNGIIQQYDKPEILFNQPANKFVAKFMGVTNVFDVSDVRDNNYISLNGMEVRAKEKVPDVEAVAIRPESINVQHGETKEQINTFNGVIIKRVFTGMMVKITIELSNKETIVASALINSNTGNMETGDKVHVSWEAEDVLLLKPEIR